MRVTSKIFTILFVCCLVAPLSAFGEDAIFTLEEVETLLEAQAGPGSCECTVSSDGYAECYEEVVNGETKHAKCMRGGCTPFSIYNGKYGLLKSGPCPTGTIRAHKPLSRVN